MPGDVVRIPRTASACAFQQGGYLPRPGVSDEDSSFDAASKFCKLRMNAIKKTRRLIEAEPASQSAQTLARLVRALESDEKFALADLYELDYDNFDLAIEILKEWRLDRYYMGKAKLHDLSVYLSELQPEP
ncbi:MAG: hypothetical protein LH479_08235 [Polaromonas sp.]|nr:hypothetical protein [Polaromonas sp.]